MPLDYPTRLIYCQNEVNPPLPSFIVYNHILEVRISPNRTQRNIIVYEEIQNKTKAVDEFCLSINDPISAHIQSRSYTIAISGDVTRRISPITSVSV